MKPREPVDDGRQDLFRARLDQIIDMKHPKVVLARAIDWDWLAEEIGAVYKDGRGYPPLPVRLMAGLHILKYMDDLSDEEVCRRFVENPYYQYFCGEVFFRHELPFDRSSLTRWRQRLGEEKVMALLQASLMAAVRLGAARPSDFTRVIVDTTVQEKNITHPTDAKLMDTARRRLARLAKTHGVRLRQSYARVGKRALIKHQRYRHAKQYKRANREKRRLSTYLGRVIRDIRRKIAGNTELGDIFRAELWKAERVRTQKPRDGIPKKIYSLHAPEVECIGKGKAHKPWEFGVKVSVATPWRRSKGGQFVAHVKALPGRPYDGHTLRTVLPEIEKFTGAALERVYVDDGYRGHGLGTRYKFKVFTSSQKRGVTKAIRRELRRRAAVEPVIGHLKASHRMGRNYLAHALGDAVNAVLAAAGYNFRLLINWIITILLALLKLACATRRISSLHAKGI